MGKVIRNVLISVAAVVVFVGAGFAIGSTGFRWNQFAREGFWGFSSHQWGILLSGIVGAMAGGAVAILVLWGTLRAQARWTESQLKQSERHHNEQIVEQRKILAAERAVAVKRDREDRAISALVEWSDALQGIQLNAVTLREQTAETERSLVRPIGAFRRAPHGWEGIAYVAIDVHTCFTAALTRTDTNALSVFDREVVQAKLRFIGAALSAFDTNDATTAKEDMTMVARELHMISSVISAAGVPITLRTPAPPEAT